MRAMVEPALRDVYRRYLRVLGIDGAPQGIEGLRRLVLRHVTRVPFENVSKLLLYEREEAGRPITLGEFLDGLERRDLGGTCYSSNPFLWELLRALGYDADLLAADMARPDVHTSIRVRLDGREYHVDAGYAAPFRYPIPLDPLPHAIANGRDRYVFDRAARAGSYELAMFVKGQRRHGYVVHPPPRSPGFFAATIVGSFEPRSTFMRCLRLSRIFEDGSADVRNRMLIVARGDSCTETMLNSMRELRDAVASVLMMPRCPVEDAVAILERLTGQAFFGAEHWADSLDD